LKPQQKKDGCVNRVYVRVKNEHGEEKHNLNQPKQKTKDK